MMLSGSNTVMSASIPTCTRPFRRAWSVIRSRRRAGMIVIRSSPSMSGMSPSSLTYRPRKREKVPALRGCAPGAYGIPSDATITKSRDSASRIHSSFIMWMMTVPPWAR